MKYQVKQKQPNSKMCLVCGLQNQFGLKTAFYELENQELLGIFTPMEEHQSYPGRLHGGISAAILDETIGRAIMMDSGDEDIWGVTMKFSAVYKKPIPLNEELRVVSRITKDTRLVFEGTGEILLEDGTVAVEGQGKYLKMTLDKISDNVNPEHLDWRVVPSEDDPVEIEV
jgi:acyl-coenzyme A thioesterase PaaI-like protein